MFGALLQYFRHPVFLTEIFFLKPWASISSEIKSKILLLFFFLHDDFRQTKISMLDFILNTLRQKIVDTSLRGIHSS